MNSYGIPRTDTVLALSSAWLAGLALIFGVGAGTASSTGELVVRVLLAVGAVMASTLLTRAAMDCYSAECGARESAEASATAGSLTALPLRAHR